MGKFPAARWLKDQWVPLPKVSKFAVDLSGKTVIIVGANTGIGLEAARHFARMKPGKLILGCRNMEKATKAVEGMYFCTIYIPNRRQSPVFWNDLSILIHS